MKKDYTPFYRYQHPNPPAKVSRRYTVQVIAGMSQYTAYVGVLTKRAQQTYENLVHAVMISHGSAEVIWRENDKLTRKTVITDGTTPGEETMQEGAK